MSFNMDCPHCKKILNVTEKAYGKTLPCPDCHKPVKIPPNPGSRSATPPSDVDTSQPSVSQEISPTPLLPMPPTSGTPSLTPLSTSTRVCEWCAEFIPDKALKCPHCTKWRKDISEDRKKLFTNVAAFVACFLFGALLFAEEWKKSAHPVWYGPVGSAEPGAWHEKVVTKTKAIEIMGTPMPGTDQKVSYEFSVSKFLSSFSGWLIIVCAIGGVWGGILARSARDSLERKTGSRWRL